MLLIQRVTADPYQTQTLVLDDGTAFSLTLYYRELQRGWFIDSLIYDAAGFELYGMRVVNSPNMLNQWRNKLPFGLGCFTEGNREPTLQQDFVTRAAKLYVLTQAEVQEYTEFLQGG